MRIRSPSSNARLIFPLLVFAAGTLYVGSSYGPVSSFIPFWASIFMLLACVFVLLGFDNLGGDDEATALDPNRSGNRSVLAAMLWITAFVGFAYVIGLIPAAVVYTFSSMYFFGGKKLMLSMSTSVVRGLILFGLFELILEKELYKGVFIEGFA